MADVKILLGPIIYLLEHENKINEVIDFKIKSQIDRIKTTQKQ